MNPEDELKKGISILDQIMIPHGFKFVLGSTGKSSSGPFASGYYIKENRRLNLSVRFSLGCVTCQVDGKELDHSEYMQAVGIKGEYPSFSEKVNDAFKHLATDIQNHGLIFLNGSVVEFNKLFKFKKDNPPKEGFGAL